MRYRIIKYGKGETAHFEAHKRFLFFFWRSVERDYYEAWDYDEPMKYKTREDAQAALCEHAGREVHFLRSTFGINKHITYMS